MKKNILITIFLVMISILIIILGKGYASEQEKKMFAEIQNSESTEGSISQESTNEEDESADTGKISGDEQLKFYKENINSLTAIEKIDYQSLLKSPAVLTYYGDIDSSSDWYAIMNNYIAEHTDELEVQNAVYPESDTYELYIEQTTTNVVAMEPDIIVYRMPALADKVRDIGLSETNDYLSSILTTLMDSLPDTEIILVEPEPVLSEMENLNSRSLDYRSYMNEMKEVANDMEIQVISTHEQFINIAEEEGFELAELYKEDETSLNENGLIILQQAIERGLTTKTEE